MEQNDKKFDSSLFIRIGIIVLTTILLVGIGVRYLPKAISVSNTGSRNDLPIFCVDTVEDKLALSFDVTWGNENTASILEILKRNDVKATFFLTGEWVRKYPDEVKAIAAAGHDIGNYSESHKHMSGLSKEQCIEELMKAHNRVKELTGKEMFLFRPPYGDFNDTLLQAARECKYYTVQWNVDSEDWKDYGAESIINKTVNNKKLGNGSIILLHSGAKYTSEVLEDIIVGFRNKGYEIVPVSQLIIQKDYTVDHTGKQCAK